MQEIALTSVKFKDKIPINLFEDNLPSNTVKSPKTTSKRLRILENPDSQLKSKRRSDMKDRQIFDEEYAKASAKLKKVKHKKKIENKIENPSKEELYDEYKRSKLKEEQKDNTSNLSASPKKQKQRKKKKSRPSLKVASPQNETNVLTEIAQEHMEHHSPTQKSSEGDPQLMPKVTKKLTKIKLFESLSSLEHHPEINFYKKETDKHISHDLKSLESEL